MREILFRGKRLDNGEWVVGNLFIPDREDTPTQICIGTNVVRITYDVDPETVGQYIGCWDKNDKKIFEGDVIERSLLYPMKERCVIEYDGASFIYSTPKDYRLDVGDGIDDHEYGIDVSCYEIIGNIHDNPELMPEKLNHA